MPIIKKVSSRTWKMRFRKAHAFIKGHFVLSSGLHAEWYGNFAIPLNRHPKLCHQIAIALRDLLPPLRRGKRPGIACAGNGSYYGFLLSLKLAEKRGWKNGVFVFARRNAEQRLRFDRGQSTYIKGRSFIIVDDVFSTGKTLKELAQLIRRHGGSVLDIVTILNRSETKTVTIGRRKYRISSILHEPLESWEQMFCPLCREGEAFSVDVEKGEEWFRKRGQLARKK